MGARKLRGAPMMSVQSDSALAFAERTLDQLELSAVLFRRFLGVEPAEVLELTALGNGAPRVCYARGEAEMVAAMRAGDALRAHGVYVVANRLSDEYTVRRPCGRWGAASKRAADAHVAERRCVYFDLDAPRAPGTSATDAEKQPVYDAADAVEAWLAKRLGRACLGRGDSGNGLSVFIALQATPVSELATAKLKVLLQQVAAGFNKPGAVTVDTRVANPARLVPAFGTLKRKGPGSEGRPHRRTAFICRGTVERIPLKELIGVVGS